MKKASILDVRHPSISTNENVDFTHLVVDFLISNRLEISMFFVAALSYLILRCFRLPHRKDLQKQFKEEQTTENVEGVETILPAGTPLPSLQQHCGALDFFSDMRMALRSRSFNEALKCLKDVKAAWNACPTAMRAIPQSVMSVLVEIAKEKQQLRDLVRELRGLQLPCASIDTMLAKCIGSGSPDTVACLECLARARREVLVDSTYALLVKAMHPGDAHTRKIVEEILGRDGSSFSPDLASALIKHSSVSSDIGMVDRLLLKMKPKQISMLSEFMWFYIGLEQFEKACDVYENHMQPVLAHTSGISALPTNMQESIVDVAVVCGRTHLAQQIMNGSKPHQARFMHLVDAIIAEWARWNAIITQWVVLVF
jgi:hypothetical protein